MALGVILNRVFRTDNNPLFEYVYQNIEDIDQCYYIIPKEDFGNEAKMKRNYYYGTLQKFVHALYENDIQPFLMDYDELVDFFKEKGINEVVIAGDIMSYHKEEYDILHQRENFKKEDISVTTIRANHYFKPSKTRNNKGEPYKVFTSFYKKWRPYLMKRTVYNYDIKDLAKVGVKSKQKLKGDYSQSGISEETAQYKWSDFLDKDIEDYDSNREYLPEVLTSQLNI